MLQQEAKRTVRCLTVLKEFVAECDDEHAEERAILPHGRYVSFPIHLFNMNMLQMNTTSHKLPTVGPGLMQFMDFVRAYKWSITLFYGTTMKMRLDSAERIRKPVANSSLDLADMFLANFDSQ